MAVKIGDVVDKGGASMKAHWVDGGRGHERGLAVAADAHKVADGDVAAAAVVVVAADDKAGVVEGFATLEDTTF